MANNKTIDEVFSVPDILDQVRFIVRFGVVPNAGSTKMLTLKCHSAVFPGFGNQAFQVFMHGFTRSFRGMKNVPRTITFNFYESADASTMRTLRKWHEFVVGSRSGNSGGYHSEYSVMAQLDMLDTIGKTALTSRLIGTFPSDVPDTSLSGDSSAAVDMSATFTYDEVQDNVAPWR